MALSGGIPVDHEQAFPHGCWMEGDVRPVKDYKRSTRRTKSNPGQDVQEAVRDAKGEPVMDGEGLPILVWEIEVYDPDPEAWDKRFKVKIEAARQPVPPAALEGSPFRLVVLEGLTVSPWADRKNCRLPDPGEAHRCGSRIAWSLRATGIRGATDAAGRKPATVGNGR